MFELECRFLYLVHRSLLKFLEDNYRNRTWRHQYTYRHSCCTRKKTPKSSEPAMVTSGLSKKRVGHKNADIEAIFKLFKQLQEWFHNLVSLRARLVTWPVMWLDSSLADGIGRHPVKSASNHTEQRHSPSMWNAVINLCNTKQAWVLEYNQLEYCCCCCCCCCCFALFSWYILPNPKANSYLFRSGSLCNPCRTDTMPSLVNPDTWSARHCRMDLTHTRWCLKQEMKYCVQRFTGPTEVQGQVWSHS